MAKISGRFRVLLLFTILIKITLADQDPLKDPSLEIIRNEDADENYTGNIADPNGIPCRDPTPINGVLEVISGIPFQINNVTVKLTCRHGLVFSDGTTEKIEHCYAAPTPIKVTGIWSPDQGRLVCQDPTYGSERKSVASGPTTQKPLTPTPFVPTMVVNTGPNPVPCQDPTPINGALEVMAGVPFLILNITVKVTCHQGLQFPDGSTEVTAKCLPAPTPYHITGVWVPDIPYKCIEPKTEAVNVKSVEERHQKRFLESLVCPDPSAQSNTVTYIDGDPNHLYSKVEVQCDAGLHFSNGQDTVNVTCLPLPHPCMCMAAWETQPDFQLMYNFNCTARTDVQNGIHPQAPPVAEEARRQEDGETKISKEELPDSEKETRLAKSTDEVQEYENAIPVVINSEQEIRTNNREQPNNIEKSINENEFGIYENNNQIYHKKEISNSVLDEINESSKKENIPNQNVEEETENQAENVELENNHDLTNYETEKSEVINSEHVEIKPEIENNDQLNENTEEVESNLNEHEENNEENVHTDSVEENEITEESEVHQIQAPPLAEINNELPEEIAEEDERDEAELSEADEENNYAEVNEESHGYEEEEEEEEENEGNNEDVSNEEEQDEHENEGEIEPMENNENNEHEEVENIEHESESEENVDNEIEEEQEIHQENEEEEEEGEEHEEEHVEQEQANNEPEEEHWKDTEKTYSEPSIEDSETNIVILDETLPLSGTSIVEEGEEIAPEENIVTEKIGTEEIEEHNEEEEPHMNEIPKEMEEPEIGVEVQFDDDGIERPGPLHEVQQTPFHRVDEDTEIEVIEHEEDPCLLPADSGYGKHVHTRHFFNVDTQECESFIYGGSGGNENNFETLDECVKSCYTQRS